jgi:hypothetical protein
MIRSKTVLEVTRQRITAWQDALLMLRQTQSPSRWCLAGREAPLENRALNRMTLSSPNLWS